ncbi:MAG: zf-HC2 domain-containing protein [Planctomycetota bacterium]|jgi:hypothetical protein
MNKHEQIERLLTGYALGELSQEQSSQVRSHLAECAECTAEARRLQTLLESTAQMSELSANEQTFESAKKALFETIAGEQRKEPTPRPAIGPTIVWRTIMKNRITKLAAVAAIIVIAVLAIPFGDHLAPSAYAIEQTFEALAKVRTVHAFCTDWDGSKVETWAQINPETGWEDGIYSYTLETGDILVTTRDKTYYYEAKDNLVRIDKGLAPASEVRIGRFIEDVVDYVTKQENGKIEIHDEYDPNTGKTIIVLHGTSETDEFEARIDPESKLPVSMNIIRARGGMKSIDQIYYDEALPDGIFEFEIPEDAEVVIHRAQPDSVLDDPEGGMLCEGLTEEEVCKTIIEEYWQAVIDQNWQTAQQLRPMPEKAWQHLKTYYACCRPVKLIEVSVPYHEQDCWIGPITPYLLETANGQVQTGEMIVKFRQTPGQESCVIAGPWGREMHPRK